MKYAKVCEQEHMAARSVEEANVAREEVNGTSPLHFDQLVSDLVVWNPTPSVVPHFLRKVIVR